MKPLLTLKYHKKDLYTFYNGKCQVFQIEGNFEPKQYVTFSLYEGMKYQVFILNNGKQDELSMLWQQWLFDVVPAVKVGNKVI